MILKRSLQLVAVMLLAAVAGCATAYHSYPGCGVGCNYCVPPPLPYVHYDDCGCHSCAAQAYLTAP